MRLFRSLRTPPRWLRAALVAVVLGFGLNTIAHVTHGHDSASLTSHDVSCGYCLSFGSLADTAQRAHSAAFPAAEPYLVLLSHASHRAHDPERAAQPRAPPLS